MRIGEFAQKHGITQDTVRHYLDMGLLVAEKRGGQYRFSEADSMDIEKIIELKQLDFSLTEIQTIIVFQRLSGANTDVFRKKFLSFLEEKQGTVENELQKYNKMNDFLKDKIHEINSEVTKNIKALGFPISSLGILRCPLCHHSLNMSDGMIEQNMVMEATLQCGCGYKAIINNGIYIDETAVRTKLQDGKRMPTKEEYLESSTHNYINFMYKGMNSLTENIKKYEKNPRYILELNNCVGFFLLQYIKDLPPNATYILVDYDLERITLLKKNLEMYYEHKNFIFLCCDFHRLPIAPNVIDVVVDLWMTRDYFESTGEILLDKVLPLLKQNGLYTAAFHYIDQSVNGVRGLTPIEKEFMDREKMLKMLDKHQLAAIDVSSVGPFFEDNPASANYYGAENYQAIYAGRKK